MKKKQVNITEFTETVGSIPVRITLEDSDNGKILVKFYSDGHFRFQLYTSGELIGLFGHVLGELINQQLSSASKQLDDALNKVLGENTKHDAPKLYGGQGLTLPNETVEDWWNKQVTQGMQNTWNKPYVTTGLSGYTRSTPTPDRTDLTEPVKLGVTHRNTNEVTNVD